MGMRRLEAVGTASPEVAWGRHLQIAALAYLVPADLTGAVLR